MYGRGGPTYGGQAPSHDQPSAVTPPQPQSAPPGRGMYISGEFIHFKHVTSSFSGQYCRQLPFASHGSAHLREISTYWS